MVPITIVTGAYKPTNITGGNHIVTMGAPPCNCHPKSSVVCIGGDLALLPEAENLLAVPGHSSGTRTDEKINGSVAGEGILHDENSLQSGAPKIAKLVNNFNNYGLW